MTKNAQNLNSCSDEELMQAYTGGDGAAFELLYGRHAGRVHAFIRRRVSDPVEQGDLLQEVFLRFHKFRHNYITGLPLLPWLFTITKSVLVDSLRKKARRPEEVRDPFEPVFEAPAAESNKPPFEENVARSIETLSSQEQDILSLRYGHDLSFEQIARQLKIEPGTGRQAASRAIRKLRSLLGVDRG